MATDTPDTDSDPDYVWKPGMTSPNPGGRPAKTDEHRQAETLARQYTKQAIETLASIMTKGKDDMARLKAAQTILDRGYGRAPQSINLQAAQDITVTIAWATTDRLSYSKGEVIDMPASPALERSPWKPEQEPAGTDAKFDKAMADLTKTHKPN